MSPRPGNSACTFRESGLIDCFPQSAFTNNITSFVSWKFDSKALSLSWYADVNLQILTTSV